MIEFVCESCGERKTEDVLPGKHAIIGSARKLDEESECCSDPRYLDSRGFRERMINTEFREMVPSLAVLRPGASA